MTTALLIALAGSVIFNAIQWSTVRIARSDRGKEKGRADTMAERLDSLRAVSREQQQRHDALIVELETQLGRLKGLLKSCNSPDVLVERVNQLGRVLMSQSRAKTVKP